jgi:hypothetical protein
LQSKLVSDATQLHQIAMNLRTNALQAMENGGLLEVVLNCAQVTQDRRLSHGNGAGYVRLRKRHREWNSAAGHYILTGYQKATTCFGCYCDRIAQGQRHVLSEAGQEL